MKRLILCQGAAAAVRGITPAVSLLSLSFSSPGGVPHNTIFCSARFSSGEAETTRSDAPAAAEHHLAKAKKASEGLPLRSPQLEEMASTISQLTLKEISQLQRLLFKQLGHSDDFYEKALLQGMGGGGGGGGGAIGPATGGGGSAAATPPPAAPPPKPEKKKVEKLTADVKLEAYGPEIKIKLIKELRSVTSMSIADAKKAVEKCPGLVATNLSKADAEKLKAAFEKLGAKVEMI